MDQRPAFQENRRGREGRRGRQLHGNSPRTPLPLRFWFEGGCLQGAAERKSRGELPRLKQTL